jgi:pyruvate formate lyase activating enzyme
MKNLNRRNFLSYSAAMFAGSLSWRPFSGFAANIDDISGPSDIRGKIFKNDAPSSLWKWSHEGFLYTKLDNKKVICGICPHRCLLSPGDRSVCRSKVNIDGKLFSLAYGNPCAVHVDPIEKKPLFHFMPNTKAFSIAAAGCNLRCLNCQNWEISQAKPHEVRHEELLPVDVVNSAQLTESKSIAYTYTEPVTFFEYMIETARIAREKRIYNVLVSAGYINREPLLELCKVLDAANVNLKSFSEKIYLKLNGAHLNPVLDTFKTLHEKKVHFEITNLVVPEYVDDSEMVKKMCEWILTNLGPDHPLHFLRFFPKYKLDRLPPTPVSTLTQIRELAIKEGINYVYAGNVPGHEGNNTYCHNCKRLLVERNGYFIPTYNIEKSRCRFCRSLIPGVWEDKPQR